MTLILESDAVVVSSLSPGDTVALVGLSRRMFHSVVRSERRDEWLEDSDLDGMVRLPLEDPAAEQSVWLAVNVTQGSWTVATGSPDTGGPLAVGDGSALVATADFSQVGPYFEFLIVRPGTKEDSGAWGGGLADGTPQDADGEVNRLIGVSPPELIALGTSPLPPAGLQAGDIVAVLDPGTLHYGVEEVEDGNSGGEVTQ